jgi:hypothetical protein
MASLLLFCSSLDFPMGFPMGFSPSTLAQVGSPRDLSMPAAKLLRGHLAEVVRKLSS